MAWFWSMTLMELSISSDACALAKLPVAASKRIATVE
jgi:hypothetical protein